MPYLKRRAKKLYTSFKSRVLLGRGLGVFCWGFFGMYLGSCFCNDGSDMGRAEFWLPIFQDRHLMLHNVWQSCWAKANKRQILQETQLPQQQHRDETMHRMNQMNTEKVAFSQYLQGFQIPPPLQPMPAAPFASSLAWQAQECPGKGQRLLPAPPCLHCPALPGPSMPQTCFNSSANPLVKGNFLLGQFCHWLIIFSRFHSPPLAPNNLNYFKLVTPEIHLGASFLQYVDWIYITVIELFEGSDIISQSGQLSCRLLYTAYSKSIQSSWNTLEIISLQFSTI